MTLNQFQAKRNFYCTLMLLHFEVTDMGLFKVWQTK